MQYLKQSTAATVTIGPILDSTGAEYTGAVIGDISIRKSDGTSSAALASAATLTHDANGYYKLVFTTGNTDTLGRLDLNCNKSTYQMPQKSYMVLPATVYDAIVTNATTAAGGLGDIQRMAGTALTGRDIGASVLLSSGTGTGQLDFTSGVVKANATQWVGGAIPAVNVTGVPLVDAKYLLGTIFSTPATAGILDVNLKNIANAAVSTSTAQLGVNVVNFGGSAGTFASGRPEVNTTHAAGTAWGSGAITAASIAAAAITSAKFAADAIDSNALAASAVTEIQSGLSTLTQSQITGGAYALNSASFAFNAALDFTTTQKAATLARVTLVDTLTTYTGNTPQTGDSYYYVPTIYNSLVAAIGAVADASATTTVFKTNLTDASNFWNDCLITFTSGALAGQTKPIASYSATNGTFTLDEALTSAPANGVAFNIIRTHVHPVTQIAAGVRTELTTELGRIDAATSSRMATYTQPTGFLAATFPTSVSDATLAALASAHGAGSWATATGFSVAGDAMTLTAAYDAAKTAASATNLALVKASTDLLTSARMGALDDWINGGRLDLILDAILADTGTDGVVVADLSAAICNKLADHVRRRTQANVEASANGDTLSLGSEYGFIQQAQESAISAGTLTVKKTDGTTTLDTKSVSSSASADPITGIN